MTSVKVFVGGLPHDITPRELREALPEIPMLGDPIIRSQNGQFPFAFVQVADEATAQRAIDRYNKEKIGDRFLTLDFARRQTDEVPSRRPDRPRTGYPFVIRGLSSPPAWNQIKDEMREFGTVEFVEVRRDNSVLIKFKVEEEAFRAMDTLASNGYNGVKVEVFPEWDTDRSDSGTSGEAYSSGGSGGGGGGGGGYSGSHGSSYSDSRYESHSHGPSSYPSSSSSSSSSSMPPSHGPSSSSWGAPVGRPVAATPAISSIAPTMAAPVVPTASAVSVAAPVLDLGKIQPGSLLSVSTIAILAPTGLLVPFALLPQADGSFLVVDRSSFAHAALGMAVAATGSAPVSVAPTTDSSFGGARGSRFGPEPTTGGGAGGGSGGGGDFRGGGSRYTPHGGRGGGGAGSYHGGGGSGGGESWSGSRGRYQSSPRTWDREYDRDRAPMSRGGGGDRGGGGGGGSGGIGDGWVSIGDSGAWASGAGRERERERDRDREAEGVVRSHSRSPMPEDSGGGGAGVGGL